MTAPIRAVTRGPEHHSFGYYDKCPWDDSGRYLLALRAPFCDRSPGPDDVATLGVVDLLEGNCFRPFAETRAWNWQQGCMLQWLPPENGPLVIYNDRDAHRFVSIVCDAFSGRVVRRLPLPVYSISHDGQQALTLNFARLHHQRPGYGYAGLPDPWRTVLEPEVDGISWLNLKTGQHRLVLTIAELAHLRRKPSMEGAIHRFNHLQFCPDDTRFVFLHRWRPVAGPRRGPAARLRSALRGLGELLKPAGEYAGVGPGRRLELGRRGLRRLLGRGYGIDDAGLTRLATARPDGSGLAVLADEDLASHFDWRDSGHLLAWARWRGIEGFHLFEDRTDHALLLDPAAMPRDGHCSYSPDHERRWILNDSGPDYHDLRDLYLYDTVAARRIDLGRFYSPPKLAADFRCDLHPRWSRDGRQVCIDSAHEGTRQLYVLDVSGVVGAE